MHNYVSLEIEKDPRSTLKTKAFAFDWLHHFMTVQGKLEQSYLTNQRTNPVYRTVPYCVWGEKIHLVALAFWQNVV